MNTEESNMASSSMKIPIFNGIDRSKYQEWEDDLIAILEYHDLEEYTEEEFKDVDIPDKGGTNAKLILQRKEMKKAKSIFVRATKDLPNMLVKEANTPYEALSNLRKKYSVEKIREDFDTLDTEWNEFKVNEISTDPDLIFKTLEEQSKKLKVFGDRYEKDSLQTLSKLKYALPNDYDHVFTFLNTSEERQKTYDEQLLTAKSMINSHYKTKIKTETNEKGGTMLCLMAGTGEKRKANNYICDHCGKANHTAYRDGKPFCRQLITDLKSEKNNNGNGNSGYTFKGKCFTCGGNHKKTDCPKNKDKNKDEDKDINSLFVTCVITDDKNNVHNVKENDKEQWLGDTGAQFHVKEQKKMKREIPISL